MAQLFSSLLCQPSMSMKFGINIIAIIIIIIIQFL